MDLTPDVERIVQSAARRFRSSYRDDLAQDARIALLALDAGASRRTAQIVARRAMIDSVRRTNGRPGQASEKLASPTERITESLVDVRCASDFARIDAALDVAPVLRKCPRRVQRAVRMRYLYDLSIQECASRLGISKKGFHSLVNYARVCAERNGGPSSRGRQPASQPSGPHLPPMMS